MVPIHHAANITHTSVGQEKKKQHDYLCQLQHMRVSHATVTIFPYLQHIPIPIPLFTLPSLFPYPYLLHMRASTMVATTDSTSAACRVASRPVPGSTPMIPSTARMTSSSAVAVADRTSAVFIHDLFFFVVVMGARVCNVMGVM